MRSQAGVPPVSQSSLQDLAGPFICMSQIKGPVFLWSRGKEKLVRAFDLGISV